MQMTTHIGLVTEPAGIIQSDPSVIASGDTPCRVVGFPEQQAEAESPISVLPDQRALSRQSSLTEALHLLGQPAPLPKLSIRTKGVGARGGQQRVGSATHISEARHHASQLAEARRTASALFLPALPLENSGSCLALSKLHTASLEIPRMQRASTCPMALDEELIAAALQLPAPSPASTTPSQHSSTPPTEPAHSPSSYATASSHSPFTPHSQHSSQGQEQERRLERVASVTRQVFEAQAEVTTAHAQIACLREALIKERQRAERLHAELRRVKMERDELQRGAAQQQGEALGGVGPSTAFREERDVQDQDEAGCEREPGVQRRDSGGLVSPFEFVSPFGDFSPSC